MQEGDDSKAHVSGDPEQAKSQSAQPAPEKQEKIDYKALWKRVSSFSKKHAMVLVLILVLVLQFVPNAEGTFPWGGMWMRMQTKELPAADKWAEDSVNNAIRAQVSGVINQQYPNLPKANKDKLIKDKIEEFKEQATAEVERQRRELAKEIRGHFRYEKDGKEYQYMPDIDTYFYLRGARNIVEKGHVYDELKEGEPWDNHKLAPIGTRADSSIHAFVLAWIYNIMSMVNPSIPLMEAANYFPIIFMLLSFIPAFFIGRRLAGNVGGFFSVTLLAVMPAIMSRTPWGHADTDAYNIFFPLYIVWLLVEMKFAEKMPVKLTYAALAGLAVALYSKAWGGWSFMFLFALVALIAYIAALVARNVLDNRKNVGAWLGKNVTHAIALTTTFVVSSMVFLSIIRRENGFGTVWSAMQGVFGFTNIKNAAHATLLPNVMTTVAELNPGSWGSIIAAIGGNLLFFLALLGVFLIIIRNQTHKAWFMLGFIAWFGLLMAFLAEAGMLIFIAGCALMGLSVVRTKGDAARVYTAVLLLFWFAGTVYASFKGIRFTLLAGPAFAIAFGACIGILAEYVPRWMEKQVHIPRAIGVGIIIVLAGLFIMNPVSGSKPVERSYTSVTNDVPLVNDAWWNVLTKIKEDSEPDAIINSWWDYGHFFKYIADRPVTFDGGSQNTPQAHWIGRALQTDNEQEAVGILRMLDCGAHTSMDVIKKQTNDPVMSAKILKKAILMDREDARAYYAEQGVDPDSVIDLTHCDPPENYFITSGDMVGKAGVWSHFGLWDFERADIWLNLRKLPRPEGVQIMQDKFDYSEKQAGELYDEANALGSETEANRWISPWVSYGGSFQACQAQQTLAICGNIAINLSNFEAQVRVDQGVGRPHSVVVTTEDGFEEIIQEDANADASVLLAPQGNGWRAMLVDRRLAKSMFTRLFFLEGHGTQYFEKFAEDNQLAGGKVIAWKVDWSGSQDNQLEQLKPRTKVEAGARVLVNYIGYLENGTVFDASIPSWQNQSLTKDSQFTGEFTPLQFVSGSGQLIKGFDQGLQGMRPEETKVIEIPPEEAYGTDPSAHPLANKTLFFKVQVVAVE